MKRIIALFLCICLVMTVAPVTALARESSVSITFHCDPSAVNDANILVDGMAETTLFDCESFVTEADAISLQFDVYCPYRIAVDDGVSPYTLTREDLVDDKTFDINYDANATNVSVTIYPSDADDYHFHPVECNYIRLIDPTLQTEPTFSDMEFASAVGFDDVLVGFYAKGNGHSDNQFAKVDYEVPTIVADGCVVVYPYGIENLENVFVLHGGAVIDPSGKKFQDSHNSDIGLSDNPTIEELFTANYDDLLPSCYFYDFRTGNDAELPVGRVFDYDTVGSDIPVEVNDYIHAHYFYAPSAYIASPGSGAPDGFLELDDNGELNVAGTITGYPGARIRLGVYTPFIIDDNPVDVYDEQSQSNMLLAGDQDYHVELEYVCYDEGEDLWRWQIAPPNDGPMPQHFFMWYDQGQATVTLSGGDYNDMQVDDRNNYPFEMNTEYTFTVTFNDPEHTTIIGDIVDSAVDYSLVEQPHITTTTFTYTPENDSCVEINLWFDQGLYDFDHFQKEDGHVFVEAFQVGQHGWISDVYVNDHTINGEDKISNQGNLKANISSDEGKLELFFYLDQNVNLEGIRFPDGWGEYIFANNGYPEDVSYDGENIVTFDNFERFLYDNHFRVELLFTGWDEQPDPPGPEEGLEVRYDDTTFDATVYYMDGQDEEICYQDMQYSGDRAPYQNQDSAYALVHFEQKPDLGFERKVYGIIARTNDPSVSYYWIYNPDSPMEYVVADNEITQVELIDWAYAFPNQYIMYFDRGIGGVQVNDIAVDDGEIYDWPANQDYIALTFSVKPYKVEVFADNYTEIIDDAAFTDDTHLNIYRRDEEGIRVATYWSEEEFDFNHFDGGSYQYYYTAYAYGDGLVVSANTEGNEETTAYHGCIKIKTNDQPITFGYQEGDGSVLEGIRDNGEEYLFDLENEVYNLPDNFSLDRNNKTLTITLPDENIYRTVEFLFTGWNQGGGGEWQRPDNAIEFDYDENFLTAKVIVDDGVNPPVETPVNSREFFEYPDAEDVTITVVIERTDGDEEYPRVNRGIKAYGHEDPDNDYITYVTESNQDLSWSLDVSSREIFRIESGLYEEPFAGEYRVERGDAPGAIYVNDVETWGDITPYEAGTPLTLTFDQDPYIVLARNNTGKYGGEEWLYFGVWNATDFANDVPVTINLDGSACIIEVYWSKAEFDFQCFGRDEAPYFFNIQGQGQGAVVNATVNEGTVDTISYAGRMKVKASKLPVTISYELEDGAALEGVRIGGNEYFVNDLPADIVTFDIDNNCFILDADWDGWEEWVDVLFTGWDQGGPDPGNNEAVYVQYDEDIYTVSYAHGGTQGTVPDNGEISLLGVNMENPLVITFTKKNAQVTPARAIRILKENGDVEYVACNPNDASVSYSVMYGDTNTVRLVTDPLELVPGEYRFLYDTEENTVYKNEDTIESGVVYTHGDEGDQNFIFDSAPYAIRVYADGELKDEIFDCDSGEWNLSYSYYNYMGIEVQLFSDMDEYIYRTYEPGIDYEVLLEFYEKNFSETGIPIGEVTVTVAGDYIGYQSYKGNEKFMVNREAGDQIDIAISLPDGFYVDSAQLFYQDIDVVDNHIYLNTADVDCYLAFDIVYGRIGDVNGDNATDMKDVLALRKMLVNLTTPGSFDIPKFSNRAADMRADDVLDMKDVLALRRALLEA